MSTSKRKKNVGMNIKTQLLKSGFKNKYIQ